LLAPQVSDIVTDNKKLTIEEITADLPHDDARSHPICPLCKVMMNPIHPAFCSKLNVKVIFRHNGVFQRIFELLKARGTTCTREEANPFKRQQLPQNDPNWNKRPDLQFIDPEEMTPACADVAVTSGSITSKETEKIRKYSKVNKVRDPDGVEKNVYSLDPAFGKL